MRMVDKNLQAYNCNLFSSCEMIKQQMSNKYKHNLVSINQTRMDGEKLYGNNCDLSITAKI